MKSGLSIIAVGHATSLTLAITFSICVVFDLLFPDMAMYQVWIKLLPGFEWITWRSYLLGVVESYGYGWYFALVWVPLYNVFAALQSKRVEKRANSEFFPN
jgi:cytochrome c biogenesis protein CcdA